MSDRRVESVEKSHCVQFYPVWNSSTCIVSDVEGLVAWLIFDANVNFVFRN